MNKTQNVPALVTCIYLFSWAGGGGQVVEIELEQIKKWMRDDRWG